MSTPEILESTATWKLRIWNEFFALLPHRLPTLFQLGFYRRNVMKAFFPPDFLIYCRRIYRFCFLSFKVAEPLADFAVGVILYACLYTIVQCYFYFVFHTVFSVSQWYLRTSNAFKKILGERNRRSERRGAT